MNSSIRNIFNGLDSITYNHSIRVMSLAKDYTEYAKIETDILVDAALVHDIGKSLISGRVLDKVESLSPVEREIISIHPYVGYRILKEFNVKEDVCRIILYHHSFQPNVLTEIEDCHKPMIYNFANILRTLDIFEAITSDRPYHNAMPVEEAIKSLMEDKNSDPDVIEFLRKQATKINHDSSCAVDKRYYIRDTEMVDLILTRLDPANIKNITNARNKHDQPEANKEKCPVWHIAKAQ